MTFTMVLLLSQFIALVLSIDSNILIEWSNITVTLGDRTILSLSSGSINKGRLLGILGPSGSGKSTLLNVLADRLPIEKSTSQKRSNKKLKLFSDLRSILSNQEIAFIYQQDTFFPMITVIESLYLSAALTLQYSEKSLSSFDRHSIDPLISELLESLTISHIRNSFVGSMEDDSNRGISGGERKRLAVAKEMIKSPGLMLADEPTSGLDAFQALHVMQVFHDLARDRNLAIVCTIHQPRASIWNLLDDVVILSSLGRPIYSGPRDKISEYFSSIDLPIPNNTNPAEYLIDLVSIDNTDESTKQLSLYRTRQLVDKFSQYSSLYNREMSLDNLVENNRSITSIKKRGLIGKLKRVLSTNFRRIVNSFGRIKLLLQRSILQILRDVSTNIFQVAVNAVLSLVLYAVYGRQTDEIRVDSITNRVMILTNSVILVSMSSIVKTLQLFKRERAVITREKSQGQYTSFEYLFSKLLSELPWNALVTSIFGFTVHQLTNLKINLPHFLTILSLLNFCTSSLGLAIGSLFQNGDEALSIGPGVMIVYLIIGAVGPSGASTRLPWFLEPLRSLSPIKWACEAVLASELSGQSFAKENISPTGLSRGPLGVIRSLLSTIVRFVQIIPMIIRSNRGPPLCDGDEALRALKVPIGSATSGVNALAKMTLANVLVTWLGLVLHKAQ
eukprot:gene20112-26113_t